MATYPNLRLRQDIEFREMCDDGDTACTEKSRAKILQLSESDTHTCIRLPGRTACVMNAGLQRDRSTGTIYTTFNSDWLHRISRAGELADVCSGDFFSCGISADAEHQLICLGSSEACSTGVCSPPAAQGGFTRLTCGTYHACAITAKDSLALCWGVNDDGMAQPPDGPFQRISAGARHTCGIRFNGRAVCWGSNEGAGELEGTLTWQATPPPIRLQEIAAGETHSCGIVAPQLRPLDARAPPPSAGRVVCWGNNRRLQASPPDLLAVAVFAGSQHSCAVTAAEGLLVCWGDKSISRRFAPGQRGPANPPADLTICSARPRFFQAHYLSFRAISESFLHNVADGASQVLLPADESPLTTPYLVLSPSFLVAHALPPAAQEGRPPQSLPHASTRLEVAVYRLGALGHEESHLLQGKARAEEAGSDDETGLVVICFFGYVGGREAARGPVRVSEGGGRASMHIAIEHLPEGVHELLCELGVGDAQPLGAALDYVSSLGGAGAVYVSSVPPTLELLSPVAGTVLPLPLSADDSGEEWGVDPSQVVALVLVCKICVRALCVFIYTCFSGS